jgi:hypothetical protein
MQQLNVTIEEMYTLIGEQYTIRYKLDQVIQAQNKQIEEMSAEITRLREQTDGKLGQSPVDYSIRRIPG